MVRKINLLAGASLTAMLTLAGSAALAASAGSGPSNAELGQRLERLESDMKQQKDKARQEKEQGEIANALPDAFQWSYQDGRPRIRSRDGQFELALRARFHFDAAAFMQDDSFPALPGGPAAAERDLGSGAIFRRSQFGVEGKVWNDFQYEIRYEFGGSGAEGTGTINLMRLQYNGIPNTRINVGVIQPLFTLDDSTSSNDITFMERSAVVNAILSPFGGSDSRRGIELGFQKTNLFYEGSNLLLAGAYTGGTTTSSHGSDEGSQLLGRAAWRVFSDVGTEFQIGVNGAMVVSTVGGTPSINIQERPNVRVDGTRLVSTGAIATDDGGWLYGAEAALQFDNFMLQGEYYEFGVDERPGALPDAEFSGWYVQGSWILTGEWKRYSTSAASWNGPKVVNPFSLKNGTFGALEAAVRYDVLDLNSNEGVAGAATPAGGIRGGEQDVWTFGLNWYLNNNVRVMANYMMVDVDRLNTGGAFDQRGQELDVIAGRLQFAF